MDVRDMINGGKMALVLLLFTIAIAVAMAINSFVGLFIGGSLQTAGASASFSTDVEAGFNTTVENLITNITGVQTPFSLWVNLLSVILVLAVFSGFIYLGFQIYNKSKGGSSSSGNDMGY